VGGYFSSGQIKVSLSDNSAAPYTLTTPSTSGQWDQNFFITYQGASAGATVNVVWTLVSGDNITLNGAALSPSTTAGASGTAASLPSAFNRVGIYTNVSQQR
jgi:hypothetical protein